METTVAVNTINLSSHSVSVATVTEYGEFLHSTCINLLPWLQLIEISLVLGGTIGIKMLTSLLMGIEDDVS